MPVLEQNPLTSEKIAPWRRLFFDRRLSCNGSLVGRQATGPPSGFTGWKGTRNSPALINRGRLPELGRAGISERVEHRGAFKTSTLREIARTGPYLGDGSLAALEDVVAFTFSLGQSVTSMELSSWSWKPYKGDLQARWMEFLSTRSRIH